MNGSAIKAPRALTLSPLWRNALRLWLATSLAIGILLWCGQTSQLGWALILAVIFINENDISPLRNSAQVLAAALVGILTGLVVHHIATGWLMLAIGMLLTGVLVRTLGLLQGLSMGYLMSWAIGTSPAAATFSWTLFYELGLAVVVGTLCAQVATWVFWPRSPLRQLPELERGLAGQLLDQMRLVDRWLREGGPPPPSLRSRQLLPQIQQLQQLRSAVHPGVSPRQKVRLLRRWAQAGDLWRQLLRQWLLLEPLLLLLPAPLPPAQPRLLLLERLELLQARLQGDATDAIALRPATPAEAWIAEANHLQVSPPLLLALAAQCQDFEQLLHGRALLRRGLERLLAGEP